MKYGKVTRSWQPKNKKFIEQMIKNNKKTKEEK